MWWAWCVKGGVEVWYIGFGSLIGRKIASEWSR